MEMTPSPALVRRIDRMLAGSRLPEWVSTGLRDLGLRHGADALAVALDGLRRAHVGVRHRAPIRCSVTGGR